MQPQHILGADGVYGNERCRRGKKMESLPRVLSNYYAVGSYLIIITVHGPPAPAICERFRREEGRGEGREPSRFFGPGRG